MAECKAGMWKMIGRGTFVAFLDWKNSSTIPPIVATTGAVEPLSVRCLVQWKQRCSGSKERNPSTHIVFIFFAFIGVNYACLLEFVRCLIK